MRDLYEAIIGDKNQAYYLEKFERFDNQGPGLKASWNWPAFLFSGVWALYRKMYGWFFTLWGITILTNFIGKADSPGLGGLILIGSWVVFGVFANSLYHNNLKKKIAAAQFSIKDESKLLANLNFKGGIHTWVFWVFGLLPIIGILASIAIPAYQDYTTKTQAIEASENKDLDTAMASQENSRWKSAPLENPEPQTTIILKPYEGEYEPITAPSKPVIAQGSDPDVQDWTKRITAWYAANKDFLSDESHRAAVVRWVEKYGADPAINNAELISIIEKNALNEFGYTKTSAKLPSKGDNAPNWINSKEQKCRDQFFAAINSADKDMPLGEYAEFEEKARQRQKDCNNK